MRTHKYLLMLVLLGSLSCWALAVENEQSIKEELTAINSDTARTTWKMYDVIGFQGEPDLTACGLSRGLMMINERAIVGSGDGYNQSNIDRIAEDVAAKAPTYVVLDIESWRAPGHGRLRQIDADKYARVINGLRAAVRGRGNIETLFGYYGAPFMTAAIRDDTAPAHTLVDSQDVLMPSLYTRDPEMAGDPTLFKSFAFDIIQSYKAISVDKPIVPFIWPQWYYDELDFVPQPFWDHVLQTLYPVTDSVAVWGTLTTLDDHTRRQWDKTRGWWAASKNFSAFKLGTDSSNCHD